MSKAEGEKKDVVGPREFSEEEFKAQLRQGGRLCEYPTPEIKETDAEFSPIEVGGIPLSESVIKDRRLWPLFTLTRVHSSNAMRLKKAAIGFVRRRKTMEMIFTLHKSHLKTSCA